MIDWIKFPDNKPEKDGVVLCLSPTVGATLAAYDAKRETFGNLHYLCIRDVEYYVEISNCPKDFHFPKPSIELIKRLH